MGVRMFRTELTHMVTLIMPYSTELSLRALSRPLNSSQLHISGIHNVDSPLIKVS